MAARFGGSPADWIDLDERFLTTMAGIADEQDQKRK